MQEISKLMPDLKMLRSLSLENLHFGYVEEITIGARIQILKISETGDASFRICRMDHGSL